MKFFLPLLLLLSSEGLPSQEAVLVLEMNMSVEGQAVFQPKVVAFSGQKARVESVSESGDGYAVEVTSVLENGNQVRMDFVLFASDKGEKTVLSRPQIVTLLGEPAEITRASGDSSQETLSLAVTPSLKN